MFLVLTFFFFAQKPQVCKITFNQGRFQVLMAKFQISHVPESLYVVCCVENIIAQPSSKITIIWYLFFIIQACAKKLSQKVPNHQIPTRELSFCTHALAKSVLVVCEFYRVTCVFSLFIRHRCPAKIRLDSKALVTSVDWRSLDLLQQNSQRYLRH